MQTLSHRGPNDSGVSEQASIADAPFQILQAAIPEIPQELPNEDVKTQTLAA